MAEATTCQRYLSNEQVQQLNERHGWFQYGDAQSDVSRAFAHDAIAMHERIRAAAPDMLAALSRLLADEPTADDWGFARRAFSKATGSAS